MNREQFAELLTVQSLQNQLKTHYHNIKEEQDRWNKLNQMVAGRKDDHSTRTSDLQQNSLKRNALEKKMAEQEKRLEQVKSRLAGSPHFSEVEKLSQERQLLEDQITEFEVQILSILDHEDELKKQLSDDENFFNGSQRTLQELKEEIDAVTKKEQEQIQLLNERIQYHLSQVPPTAKSAFEEACKKHLYNKPIAYLDGNYCSICRFRQDQAAISAIIRFQSIEFCGGCGRILTSMD